MWCSWEAESAAIRRSTYALRGLCRRAAYIAGYEFGSTRKSLPHATHGSAYDALVGGAGRSFLSTRSRWVDSHCLAFRSEGGNFAIGCPPRSGHEPSELRRSRI